MDVRQVVLRIADRDVLIDAEQIARFHAKHADGDSCCHHWLASTDREGYGTHKIGRTNLFRAHRVAYMIANGPIESDQQLDHTCRNPGCVNPDHLEPVTPLENTRRSIRVSGATCRNGHERNDANVRIAPDGSRQCRVCHRAALKRYRQRAKGVGFSRDLDPATRLGGLPFTRSSFRGFFGVQRGR